MKRLASLLNVLSVFILATAIGCSAEDKGQPSPGCTPGATQACMCLGGGGGGQVCADGGGRWLDCQCVSAEAQGKGEGARPAGAATPAQDQEPTPTQDQEPTPTQDQEPTPAQDQEATQAEPDKGSPPSSPMDALISEASEFPMDSISSEVPSHEFWFLEKKKNPCPDRDDDASDFIGIPDADDEFGRAELSAKRPQLKKECLATVYNVPIEDVSVGLYDFKKSTRTLFVRSEVYTFTGRGKAECECEWDPDERRRMCDPCLWEPTPLGKKPAKDALKLKFPIAPDVAKALGDEGDAYTVTVLARVKGVYRHNKCVKSCLFGVCGNENIGAGGKLHGSLVAVRVEADGETLFEKFYEKGKAPKKSAKKDGPRKADADAKEDDPAKADGDKGDKAEGEKGKEGKEGKEGKAKEQNRKKIGTYEGDWTGVLTSKDVTGRIKFRVAKSGSLSGKLSGSKPAKFSVSFTGRVKGNKFLLNGRTKGAPHSVLLNGRGDLKKGVAVGKWKGTLAKKRHKGTWKAAKKK